MIIILIKKVMGVVISFKILNFEVISPIISLQITFKRRIKQQII